MTLWRVDDAQVRDAVSGELLQDLVGQPVQIVTRDTTSPVEILDETSSPIAESMVTVTPVFTVPRFWIDVADPSGLYLDWLDPASGARGSVNFEAVLRDAALASRDAAVAAQEAAEDAASTVTEPPITGQLAVADTATLNLSLAGLGAVDDPYVISGEVPAADPAALGDLSDVDTTGASSGDALVFDGATWEAVEPAPAVTDLGDLSDVDTAGAADGDSLVYDGAGWVAEPARNPVTVSATAPSSPQLHDIWFDIS